MSTIPTTTAEQYTRLRKYLTPYLQGPKVDAVLTALASGSASYLINNVSAVNDQLYIVSASGTYLDERLAQYGITRPSAVGLSDEIFSQLGIQVKNRKQVRDLINNLLDDLFGDEFVKANSSSNMFEPYDLNDGDTLVINFDGSNTTTITFNTAEFENINAATAQEVADVITSTLSSLSLTGTAIVQNDGNGNYVTLLSSTIGASSSVTVLGGSAQNQLVFDATVPAGGNMSTQWTISLQQGGTVRFTWSGGANPQTGKVNIGNYVNIFGGGFASSPNEGSYTITAAKGGLVNVAYFEINNPFGTSGIVTEGIDNAVLFYNPVRKTVLSRTSYAAVFQTQNRVLQIFIPAATVVVRRSRVGSAHLHWPPTGTFTFNAQPSNGDSFSITSSITLVAGVDFVIGGSIEVTMQNMVNAINAVSGLVAVINSTNIVLVQSDVPTLMPTITYTGSQNIVASGLQGDMTSVAPNQPGPYMYDTTQPFTLSSIGTKLEQVLDADQSRVIQVADSSQFPDDFGYIILGYGTSQQEGPIPYIGRPSNDTLLLSPIYTVQNVFQPGTDVAYVASKGSVVLSQDGLDYPFYLTDVVSGREYAEQLINDVAATGITIVFTVIYGNDYGLGKWGTKYSEIPVIWGP
jgi:hypothetical protein